mmetsp:Transcript_24062/g.75750  ORF Transcript_24062/g.75750 Transcript_24062/m.75750 type:complete len:221 (-) Transcript_24062:110-772(-)
MSSRRRAASCCMASLPSSLSIHVCRASMRSFSTSRRCRATLSSLSSSSTDRDPPDPGRERTECELTGRERIERGHSSSAERGDGRLPTSGVLRLTRSAAPPSSAFCQRARNAGSPDDGGLYVVRRGGGSVPSKPSKVMFTRAGGRLRRFRYRACDCSDGSSIVAGVWTIIPGSCSWDPPAEAAMVGSCSAGAVRVGQYAPGYLDSNRRQLRPWTGRVWLA